jgi:hypothetical protein
MIFYLAIVVLWCRITLVMSEKRSSEVDDFFQSNSSISKSYSIEMKLDIVAHARGIMMCAGTTTMIKSVLIMMYQLRILWESHLHVAIAHCDEISKIGQKMVQQLYPDIVFVNICEPGQRVTLGMKRNVAIKKLRGFFCKVGAMIKSPFKETMLIDLDVIWIQKPDLLFESSAYLKSGSLFFRDRIIFEEEVKQPFRKSIVKLLQTKLNDSEIKKMSGAEDNVGLFNSRGKRSLEHYQESSVVIINNSRQIDTINMLQLLLPTFSIGWGDKELFWMAASMAKDEYMFEPYLCGSYGDCGFQMHFDPRVSKDVRPFYINAEYLIEGLTYIGEHLQEIITIPVFVTTAMQLYDQDPWKRKVKEGCSCPQMRCEQTPEYITQIIVRMQWLSMSRLKLPCMPIAVERLQVISNVIQSIISDGLCATIGCPVQFPIIVNSTYVSPKLPVKSLTCVLIHF